MRSSSPALLGLPVESLLWIRCSPDHAAAAIGTALVESPQVRYAAFTMGDHPHLVDVTTRDIGELRDLGTSRVPGVEGVESALLLRAFKRGGVITSAGLDPQQRKVREVSS